MSSYLRRILPILHNRVKRGIKIQPVRPVIQPIGNRATSAKGTRENPANMDTHCPVKNARVLLTLPKIRISSTPTLY
jgi:hypothetical protein